MSRHARRRFVGAQQREARHSRPLTHDEIFEQEVSARRGLLVAHGDARQLHLEAFDEIDDRKRVLVLAALHKFHLRILAALDVVQHPAQVPLAFWRARAIRNARAG